MLATIRTTLSGLQPTVVITDLAPGWSLAVTEVALEMNVPVMSACPFPTEAWKKYRRRMRTSLLFNQSLAEYIGSPDSYIAWLRENVDMVLAYTDGSPRSNLPGLYLGKTVHDLGKGGKTHQ